MEYEEYMIEKLIFLIENFFVVSAEKAFKSKWIQHVYQRFSMGRATVARWMSPKASHISDSNPL